LYLARGYFNNVAGKSDPRNSNELPQGKSVQKKTSEFSLSFPSTQKLSKRKTLHFSKTTNFFGKENGKNYLIII
jgi:hypothetical protein